MNVNKAMQRGSLIIVSMFYIPMALLLPSKYFLNMQLGSIQCLTLINSSTKQTKLIHCVAHSGTCLLMRTVILACWPLWLLPSDGIDISLLYIK